MRLRVIGLPGGASQEVAGAIFSPGWFGLNGSLPLNFPSPSLMAAWHSMWCGAEIRTIVFARAPPARRAFIGVRSGQGATSALQPLPQHISQQPRDFKKKKRLWLDFRENRLARGWKNGAARRNVRKPNPHDIFPPYKIFLKNA